MYEYIQGKIDRLTASYVVLDVHGVGYFIHTSLFTYNALQGQRDVRLYVHQIVREDAHALYGFSDPNEREMFRLLIGVNGIGSNTAMVMLSAMGYSEIQQAIATDNYMLIKSVKGIGPKTAQRVVIELKDKVSRLAGLVGAEPAVANGLVAEEACMALVMLGFQKKNVEKTVMDLLKATPSLGVEVLLSRL